MTSITHKITRAANQLQEKNSTDVPIKERIAACFVLNRMDLLPRGHEDVVDSWLLLGEWQLDVRIIKMNYMHKIV
ncbi:MAG: hypothetical protein AAGB12_05005 [Pseudomonadota bacterium]